MDRFEPCSRVLRVVPLLVAVGCIRLGGGRELTAGFEDEVEIGWVCEDGGMGDPQTTDSVGRVMWFGLDRAEHFRIQVSLPEGEAVFGEADGADDAEQPSFSVYTGASLVVDSGDDKCDDVVMGGFQRLDYLYQAVSGSAVAVDDGGRVGLDIEGIVLRADNRDLYRGGASGWEDLPEVLMSDGRLPSF